jgi:hypothetical protein
VKRRCSWTAVLDVPRLLQPLERNDKWTGAATCTSFPCRPSLLHLSSFLNSAGKLMRSFLNNFMRCVVFFHLLLLISILILVCKGIVMWLRVRISWVFFLAAAPKGVCKSHSRSNSFIACNSNQLWIEVHICRQRSVIFLVSKKKILLLP